MTEPIIERVKTFFRALEDTPEGSSLMKLYDHTYQFQVTDAAEPTYFSVRFAGGKLSFAEGETKERDFREVTLVEAPSKTFEELVEGKLMPSQAWIKQRWWVSGQMSKRPLHGFIMRLIRTGQDLRLQA